MKTILDELTPFKARSAVMKYVNDHPEIISKLVEVAQRSMEANTIVLHARIQVMAGNHMFLADVLNNSEDGVKDKLVTKYQSVECASFNNKSILDLIEKLK